MKISTFKNQTDTTPKPVDVQDFEGLCRWLTSSVAQVEKKESAGLWSPATFTGPRKNENVSELSCLVFDIDAEFDPACLEGMSALAHSTHSGKWRVVLETTRAHTKAEHAALWGRVFNKHLPMADTSCKDAARFYYVPSSTPGSMPDFFRFKGAPVDPAGRLPRTAISDETPIDLEYYASADINEKGRALIFGPFPSVNRNGFISTGVYNLTTADVPPEHIRIFIERAVEAMPDTDNDGKAKLRREVAPMIEAKRAVVDEKRAKSNALEAAFTMYQRNELEGRTKTEPLDESEKAELEGILDIQKKSDSGVITYKTHRKNIVTVLRKDKRFKSMRFNTLTKEPELPENSILGVHGQRPEVALAEFLQVNYGMNPTAELSLECLSFVLQERAYNPVIEYLESLPPWDTTQKSNLSELFRIHAGGLGGDEYMSEVAKRFFTAAVKRAYEPGCKSDVMLVLAGPPGAHKSLFVETIASKQFCSAVVQDLTTKDGFLCMHRNWILEIPEMSGVGASNNIERLKAVITISVDDFRGPYEKNNRDHKRSSIMIGTTNDTEIIRDPTVARRFWPIRVTKIDLDWVAANRDSMWAEALYYYKQKAPTYFDDVKHNELVVPELALFDEPPSMAEGIERWFYRQPKAKRPSEVRVCDILLALEFSASEAVRRVNTNEARKAMLYLGFRGEEKTRRLNGVVSRVWHTPERLLTGQNTGTGVIISPVPNEIKAADEGY